MITPEEHKIKTALISVTDKTGIVDFAKELVHFGVEIYSTGGTLKMLLDNSVPAKSVSDLTNFPEILDGRVKTLHPAIHSGILARLDDEAHLKQLEELNLSSLDMVIVNLYPFENALKRELPHSEMIENIDIGGPTMLRSAAKNYLWTAPIVNPSHYSKVLEAMNKYDGCIPTDLRTELAAEVFNHTAYYDGLISSYFNKYLKNDFPEVTAQALKSIQSLRYGENPHQAAMLYGNNFNEIFTQLHGKELSYNNILDIDSASRIIIEFNEPAVAIIKHTNPCGVAIADNIYDAYLNAFHTDTVSAFGGIISINGKVDAKTAEEINKIFTELIIAPDYDDDAMELLKKKKDRRLIKANFELISKYLEKEIKSVTGGFLVQKTDRKMVTAEEVKCVTNRKPSEAELNAMMFGWKVVKHLKSNAVIYTDDKRTLGIGCGQMSRVDSARIGAEKAELMGLDLKGCAVASDAFFPFADGVLHAVKVGATCIIQPGGSVRDQEVIDAANEHNIAMVFTGNRHFKH